MGLQGATEGIVRRVRGRRAAAGGAQRRGGDHESQQMTLHSQAMVTG